MQVRPGLEARPIDIGGFRRHHGFQLQLTIVAVVALVVRLAPVLVGGGLGVYFAAAAPRVTRAPRSKVRFAYSEIGSRCR